MRVKAHRRGQIFASDDYRHLHDSVGFAQSPQTLILGDRVRVYYSTRRVDPEGGKFRSIVAFVDFAHDLAEILGHSRQPVLPLGRAGCFDEHGIFPFHPHRHGNRLLAFTSGWTRRASVSVDSGIGQVESFDGGATFDRSGDGPILAAGLHEPFLVGDPFVVSDEAGWDMWYIFGQRWMVPPEPSAEPERVYKIAHCWSQNGLDWQGRNRGAILPDELGADECQALPSVVRVAGGWLMVFCFREAIGFRSDPSRGYRLGAAFSADGRLWQRQKGSLQFQGAAGDWELKMQAYPHVFWLQDRLYLLYNGNEFGRYGFGLAELQWES
ncbi:MAG: hypothetical protein ORO03_03900 [Alphaproteobacteria bacterium]|nr:hypothetical protein [Alphaproteobacteria bacterium]